MSYTKVFLLPTKVIGVVCQLQPYFTISSFVDSRPQQIKHRSSSLNNFYSNHCEDCDYRSRYDDEEDEYYGECESGVDALKSGDCKLFNYEDFASSDELTITTLPYIFQTRVDPNGYLDAAHTYMYTYDKRELTRGKLMVLPYITGNVYNGANICWGSVLDGCSSYDLTPRGLHSMFWESRFNNDLVPGDHSVVRWMLNLTPTKIMAELNRPWVDATKNVKGEIYVSTNERVEGVFFSTDPVVTRKFKKAVIYKHPDGGRARRAVLGWLKQGEYRLTPKAKVTFTGLYVEVGEDRFRWNGDTRTLGSRVHVGELEVVVKEEVKQAISPTLPVPHGEVSPIRPASSGAGFNQGDRTLIPA